MTDTYCETRGLRPNMSTQKGVLYERWYFIKGTFIQKYRPMFLLKGSYKTDDVITKVSLYIHNVNSSFLVLFPSPKELRNQIKWGIYKLTGN